MVRTGVAWGDSDARGEVFDRGLDAVDVLWSVVEWYVELWRVVEW
jgi:hypothetical protein